MSLRKLIKAIRLPLKDKILFMEAAVWIITAKVFISAVPMSRYEKILLGNLVQEDPENLIGETEKKKIERVARAVNIVSNIMPWNNKCYPRAVAAKKILQRAGLDSTLYLGACRQAGNTLRAHAWTRCGDVYVTGGYEPQKQYNVLGRFN